MLKTYIFCGLMCTENTKAKKANLTFTKWEQAASTALADHVFPSDCLTITLKADTGNNPNNATMELRAVDRTEDLKHMCTINVYLL